MNQTELPIAGKVAACTECAARFAATETAHTPRPVLRAAPGARILIAGQAPGMRVHKSGLPFDDPSGDRLRDWMGVDRETFYDTAKIAVVPMAFCFPGYDKKGSDLPPPKVCAKLWRAEVLAQLGAVALTLIIGQYAQAWHLGPARKKGVTETVRAWRAYGGQVLPLPHPSWRNTGWIRKNPWFEAELVPHLRAQVDRLVA